VQGRVASSCVYVHLLLSWGVCVCVCRAGLTLSEVVLRFKTMSGRLSQGLTNWANNNPAQHR